MACGCNLRKRINKAKIELDRRDIYLDYNATTKPSIDVLASLERFNRHYWGNPSSQNSRGVTLYNLLTEEMSKMIELLHLNNSDYFFDTSSSALISHITSFWNGEVITTSIEHISLLDNSDIRVPVDSNGVLDLAILKNSINSSVNPIIIYSPVNHETGNIQPIEEIYNICNSLNTPIIIDAVQTISKLERDRWIPYCNGFYYSGHKIYGIPGAAIFISDKNLINFNTENNPLPFSLYRGTFNSPAVYGLIQATNFLFKEFTSMINEIDALDRDALLILSRIKSCKIESGSKRASGIINISLKIDNDIEELLFYLNSQNIQIGRVSACTGDINAPSYVLVEMGRPKGRASRSLRVSFGKGSKRDDFYKLVTSINSFLGLQ